MAKPTPAVLVPFYGWHPMPSRATTALHLREWRRYGGLRRTGPGRYRLAPHSYIGGCGYYAHVTHLRTTT